eukprot:4521124-Heterocapsa_arctica.AAC.1
MVDASGVKLSSLCSGAELDADRCSSRHASVRLESGEPERVKFSWRQSDARQSPQCNCSGP